MPVTVKVLVSVARQRVDERSLFLVLKVLKKAGNEQEYAQNNVFLSCYASNLVFEIMWTAWARLSKQRYKENTMLKDKNKTKQTTNLLIDIW